MEIVRVARVVWDGEAAIADGHLAFTKGQSEEAQLVQQTTQGLEGWGEEAITTTTTEERKVKGQEEKKERKKRKIKKGVKIKKRREEKGEIKKREVTNNENMSINSIFNLLFSHQN